jgi:c-di-GMP-binding flagellar brake protein YcgR
MTAIAAPRRSVGAMDERRKNSRTRVLKSGRIAVSAKAPRIECAVRNLSDGGACLQVHSGTFGIPREFELHVEGAPNRMCRVIWRTENRLGVSFA